MELSLANRRPVALLKYPLSLACEGGSIERKEHHQAKFPTQKRYRIFAKEGVRNFDGFNNRVRPDKSAPVEQELQFDEEEEEEKKAPVKVEEKSNKRKAETALESNDDKKFNGGGDDGDQTKIYVRGLPWTATEEELRDFFSSCGEMATVELPLQDDGRSSGTGECYSLIDY